MIRNPALELPLGATPQSLPDLNYIALRDGKYDGMDIERVNNIFDAFQKSGKPRLVIFFHGGLVDKSSGMASAGALVPSYLNDGNSYPLFFIWESGIFEVFQNHLPEIFAETIFKQLLAHIANAAHAQVQTTVGAAPALSPLIQFHYELNKPGKQFSEIDLERVPSSLTVDPAIQSALEAAVQNDPIINREAALIADSPHPPETVRTAALESKGITMRSSPRTLMSPSAVSALIGERTEQSVRLGFGIGDVFRPLSIAAGAVAILGRVIARFATKRDHGFQTTIVEEILRQFYLANAGQAVWEEMKKETAEAFLDDPNTYGGSAVVNKICDLAKAGKLPKITLIGHSTGAVYICNFLTALNQRLAEINDKNTQVEVIFLAPASTFTLFNAALKLVPPRIKKLRTFEMHDALEINDHLIQLDNNPTLNPILAQVYPRSLLYFVSGVCEDAVDMPLLGMDRFLSATGPFSPGRFPDIDNVLAYLNQDPTRLVLSKTLQEAPQGQQSDSQHHGGFPHEPLTLASVVFALRNGL